MISPSIPRWAERRLENALSSRIFTWRQIIDLMIPGILDSLSIMFCVSLTTALISANGETSMAAVSLVSPITWVLNSLFNGISAGGTVVVAQSYGRGDTTLLRKAIGMTLWLTIGIGILFCIPLLMYPSQVLMLLYPEAEPIVMEKAANYLFGCLWSNLLFTVYTAIFAVLRGLGQSGRCLALSVIINVANLVFSILFLNILKMDIQGSVLALFLARSAGTAAAIILLFVWQVPVKCTLKQLLGYDRSLMRSCMNVTIPLGLEQLCGSLGGIVSEMYMIRLGTTALATHAIANSLVGLLYSPAMSIGNLSVTIVGRCIGAGATEEAYHYGKRCNQLALILMVLASLIFYPALPLLLRQYNPSPESYAVARSILVASIPALFLFWPQSNTLPNTLRAANDSLYPSILSLAVLWLINIGLGYVLAIPAGLGLWGVWAALWLSWAVRCIGFIHRFRGRKWLQKAQLS